MRSPIVTVRAPVCAVITALLAAGVVTLAMGASEEGKLVWDITFPHPEKLEIVTEGEGHVISLDGFEYINVPGKPLLPAKTLTFALPPGAHVTSVKVHPSGSHRLPGTYRILPAPPILPLAVGERELIAMALDEWRETKEVTYSSDRPYPEEQGELSAKGTLRKYSYASVSVCPMRYRPLSGTIDYFGGAKVIIDYDIPSSGHPEAERIEEQKWDRLADDRASGLFINYEQVKGVYQPTGSVPASMQETYNYVIITTSSLSDAITSSDFLGWKTYLGYDVKIVLVTDSEIAGQPGRDLSEQIRNFLREYYIPWGIEYVLLVGDYATVPMRYCYPSGHTDDVPTDYYYADLSYSDDESWDYDGDGYCGEYGQDIPDFLAEVYVGRVPTNNIEWITYALNKLVAFEQDTGSWKNSALHAGEFWYFENEDYSGIQEWEGSVCMHYIETDILDGWNISHYNEQEGLKPSDYEWPAISEAVFTSAWRDGQYSVVNWGCHGWKSSTYRKIWTWDDGDGVPESPEITWLEFLRTYSSLDDDYPSTVFSIACYVNYPEPYGQGNLGINLLAKPSWGASIGVLAATRITWGMPGWPNPKGGGESMCYEFNRFMIEGPDGSGSQPVGVAFYDSKYYCNENFPMHHYADYTNMFEFNLYGEPALVREGKTDRIFDNADSEFKVLAGSWKSKNYPDAYEGSFMYNPAGSGSNQAAWRVDNVVVPGTYDVYTWKFDHQHSGKMATNAHYKVRDRSITTDWILVDQSTPGDEWVYLGTYEFDQSRPQGVLLTDKADGFVIADAVKLVYTGPLGPSLNHDKSAGDIQ
jgi:hypothetical protein